MARKPDDLRRSSNVNFFVAAFSLYLVYAVDFWPRWIFLAAAVGFNLYGLKLA